MWVQDKIEFKIEWHISLTGYWWWLVATSSNQIIHFEFFVLQLVSQDPQNGCLLLGNGIVKF